MLKRAGVPVQAFRPGFSPNNTEPEPTIIRIKPKAHRKNQNSKIHKSNVPSKTVKLSEKKTINILNTNANGLKHKSEDLKNKVKYLNSSIFAVQETHFGKKGKFKMQDFHIFEAIRKNKEQGGSMLGIHMGLQPILIK